MGSLSTRRLARRRWSAAGPLSKAVSFAAGPMVRIRFPPAVSRQTIGSSAVEPTSLILGRSVGASKCRKCRSGVVWCSSIRNPGSKVRLNRGRERLGNWLSSNRRRAPRRRRILRVRARSRNRGSYREKHRYYNCRTTIRVRTPDPGNGDIHSMEARPRERLQTVASCRPKWMRWSYVPVNVYHYL